MNIKINNYLMYIHELQWRASELLYQTNPHTAHGYGLDDMAAAIGIIPRKNNGDFTEVDSELRNRILKALEMK